MQYRPHRYPTDYTVTLATAAGSTSANVVDVNRSGARISGPDGLQRGDKLQLDILSNRVDAVVLWARSGQAGIAFRPAITDHLVDLLRKSCDGRNRHQAHRLGYRHAEMR